MTTALFLLDTNVVLHLVRGKATGAHMVETYALDQPGVRPLVSRVTYGEVRSMAQRNQWGDKKLAALEMALANTVTVEIDRPAVLDAYVAIDLYSQAEGRTMGQNDLWIAACCKAAGATLLTTDKDFDHLDPDHLPVEWVDPNQGHSSSQ